MKNSDIKYKLSTDYVRLHQLLLDGNIIIGFVAIEVEGHIYKDYSKLTQFSYNSSSRFLEVGCCLFVEDWSIKDFEAYCAEYNIRYIDIKTRTQKDFLTPKSFCAKMGKKSSSGELYFSEKDMMYFALTYCNTDWATVDKIRLKHKMIEQYNSFNNFSDKGLPIYDMSFKPQPFDLF